MSTEHTHLVTVHCDERFARDIMDSADVRGATYAVFSDAALEEVRHGSRERLHQALFGVGDFPASDTYTKPEHGWTCFHCGETFKTVGGARDHFGATPDAMPGCLIRVQLGDERGLEMALRKAEAEIARLRASCQGGASQARGSAAPVLGGERREPPVDASPALSPEVI